MLLLTLTGQAEENNDGGETSEKTVAVRLKEEARSRIATIQRKVADTVALETVCVQCRPHR